ncbi:restriction endonuclease subunit S [Marinobacter sp. M5B]|uniref:restriction endonuclease subunit S n=1 Tax=Marinobacter sp. M5B TaxID=3141535 RepID=UPI0036D33922
MKFVPFMDECDIQGGTQPPKSEWLSSPAEGYVRMLQIRDFTQPYNPKIEYVKDKSSLKKCDSDDILIARYGASIGRILTGLSGAYNVAMAKCKYDKERVDRGFLYHWLNSDKFQNAVSGFGGRAAQAGFNKKDLSGLKLPLPSMAEQKRIAKILSTADALRVKRRESLTQLDTLLKSTFLGMFGDPVSNSLGWEVVKLKDLSNRIVSGSTPTGGKQVYKPEGITFFRSQNVWGNRLVLNDIAYIDEETHRSMGKSSLKKMDILITKTGRFNTENSSLGRAAIFAGEDDSANINGHVYLVRLKKNAIHKFVLFILTTKEYREYIRRVCVGGIDKRQINKEHLEEFPIILPPLSLQRRFASIVESVEQQKVKMQTHFDGLDVLFASLQSRAFDGEL